MLGVWIAPVTAQLMMTLAMALISLSDAALGHREFAAGRREGPERGRA